MASLVMGTGNPAPGLVAATLATCLLVGQAALAQTTGRDQPGFRLESLRRLSYVERIHQALAPELELELDASELVLDDVADFHVHADLSSRKLPELKIRLFADTLYPVIPCHTSDCKTPPPETSAGVATLYSITPKTHAGLVLQRQTVWRSRGTLLRAVLGGVW